MCAVLAVTLIPGVSQAAAVPAATTSSAAAGVNVAVVQSAAGFVHPGILVSKADLDFTRSKIAAGLEPQKTGLLEAQTGKPDTGVNAGVAFSSLSWTPRARAYVGCGGSNNPNEGCFDETNDASAAYTQALLWYYTGNRANAQKAIQILNAWSSTLKDHKFDTSTYTNGHLQAAWAGEVFPRAAEIIRYTFTATTGEKALNVAQFSTMLKTAFLPHVVNGWVGAGANWLLSMAEATMNIGIFTDDRVTFDKGVAAWRAQVPATIYMTSDRNSYSALAGLPLVPPGTMYDSTKTTPAKLKAYWYNPTRWVNGLQGETCRDMNHMAMGMAAMINGAETARIQGVNLYGEQQARIVAAMELNSGFINAATSGQNPPPGWTCSTKANVTAGNWKLTWEIGYNHYAHRKGVSLPNTKRLIDTWVRPTRWSAYLMSDFETLTHVGTA